MMEDLPKVPPPQQNFLDRHQAHILVIFSTAYTIFAVGRAMGYDVDIIFISVAMPSDLSSIQSDMFYDLIFRRKYMC